MSGLSIWSSEAEQSVLGSLMIDPAAFDAIGASLGESDFYDRAHGTIYAACSRLAAGNKPIDPVTLAAALGGSLEAVGGNEYLNALAVSVPSARHAKRYAEIVRERSLTRELIAAADEAMEIAREDAPTSDKLDRISKSLAALAGRQVRKAPRRLSEVMLQRTEHYEKLASGDIAPGFPTRIPGLDKALNGGLRGGKLIFIGARPAVGKSSLAMQLLISQADQGRPGLFLSQEMANEELADRAAANVGRIDYEHLQTGQLTDDDWSRMAEMCDTAMHLPIWVDDQGGLTISDIRNKVRSLPGLKVVVLDYLQLCSKTASSTASNRNSEIEEISRALKALAVELDITIIALSQLNREVEKRPGKRPMLSDLRDSGSIEQDADVIIFLWPVRDLEAGGKLVGLGLDKNRQGRTTEVALDFRGAVQRWAESAEPLQAPEASRPTLKRL